MSKYPEYILNGGMTVRPGSDVIRSSSGADVTKGKNTKPRMITNVRLYSNMSKKISTCIKETDNFMN